MNKQKSNNKMKFNIYWIYLLIGIFFIGIQFSNNSNNGKKTNWQNVKENMIKNDDIEKIVIINREKANVYVKQEAIKSKDIYKNINKNPIGGEIRGPHYYFIIGSVENFENEIKTTCENLNISEINVEYINKKDVFGELLSWIIPLLIMIGIWLFIMRKMSGGGSGSGSQIFNIGKSKASLFDKNKVNITFKDVAGLDEAKEEVQEIINFLKNPKKYTSLGGKIPRGALLIGSPGTGKTLMAKAMAGEAQVPFFSLSGSDFVEMFVGVGASRVRDLFKQAKMKSPCIVFIDEIDAIGRSRAKQNIPGSNDERENTLNQLLSEMDGFESNSGVIIIAATNRVDVLDKALLRPGRFDRQIFVDLPDLKEREAIFKVHMKPLKTDKSVDINFLSKQTPGFSGADIANVCNESALIAARKNKKIIQKQDFLDAVDRVIGGLEKKNKIISKNEKKVIAFHEAGHAIVSWMLKYASPLVKVTIVPRGKSLGAAWYLPEERQITNTEQIDDELCATLGGRAAEEIMFGKISTGALNDLEKVTKQAYAMVSVYGLNKKIGNLSFYDSSGRSEYNFTKPYSEKTAQIIDEEVSKIIEKAYQKAKNILTKHKKDLVTLSELLLKKEVLFKEDLEKIFGKRKADESKE